MRDSIEVAKYIQKKLEAINMKPTELANRIGVDRSTVTRYLNGTRKISMDDLPKIAGAIGLSPIDLLVEKEDLPNNIVPIKTNFVKIPILGRIACGTPILAEQNIENYIYEVEEYLPNGDLFALIANGDSMEPTIPNGSRVLIREQSDIENGEIAAVLVNGDSEATLKRVKKQGNIIILMPDNSKYEPIIVDEYNPARIIGKAIRVIRDFI